jgi:lysozyme family protein
MAKLDKALNELWKVEYSNNAALMLHRVEDDSGGMTYCGIARKYHPNWKGWEYIDFCIKSSSSLKEASKNLSYNHAVNKLVLDFYNTEFWSSIKGSLIKKQAIATEMFLSCVNIGIKPCIKLAQETVGVTVDGLFGINTLTAINNTTSKAFCKKYTELEIQHYKDLVRRNPKNVKFLNGWIARAYAVSDKNTEKFDYE